MAKILLVEDDPDVADALEDLLTDELHTVELVDNGEEALERVRIYEYDLVLLDWGLPGMSGIDVCRQLRTMGRRLPVIMLTARGHVHEKEMGLDTGADDYVTKPFEPREIMARIRAVLRRPENVVATVLKVGTISLDPQSKRVTKGDKDVPLQPREYALLEFFMRNPNQAISMDAILNRVWSSESESSPDTVRVHIKNLRIKLDSEGQESYFRTVHRVGYEFRAPD
jgi:DNA-binding response OmpR family regulator